MTFEQPRKAFLVASMFHAPWPLGRLWGGGAIAYYPRLYFWPIHGLSLAYQLAHSPIAPPGFRGFIRLPAQGIEKDLFAISFMPEHGNSNKTPGHVDLAQVQEYTQNPIFTFCSDLAHRNKSHQRGDPSHTVGGCEIHFAPLCNHSKPLFVGICRGISF